MRIKGFLSLVADFVAWNVAVRTETVDYTGSETSFISHSAVVTLIIA